MKSKKTLAIVFIALCTLLEACSRMPIYQVNLNTPICSNIPGSTCDWMSQLLQANPSKHLSLADICLPGSHDAAMYMNQHCTAFANTGNTQTQYLPMKQQLESGLRIFDIRPWYEDGRFYTHHSTHCDGLGCKGDMLINILHATREFLDTHHELVILQISHPCHTSASDSVLLSLLAATLGDRIYRETKPANVPFIQVPLQDLLPADGKTGKVLITIEGAENNAATRAKGIFNDNILPTAGGWTNDNKLPLLEEHQRKNLSAYQGNGSALYTLAWQITQHNEEALRSALAPHARASIRHGAYRANQAFPAFLDSLIKTGNIRKGKIPNIIWSDFVDTAVTKQCMKLTKLNVE
jgi:hypothetical protein